MRVLSLLKNNFIKATFTVTIGTIVSQIIPLIFYPLLARLYSPADFGLLATITSITTVLCVISTGKYESSIILTKSKRDAANVIILSLLISGIVLIISLILLFWGSDYLALYLKEPELKNWFFLCPFLSFFVIIYQCYNEWCIRNKYFGNLTINKIANTTCITFPKFIGGIFAISSGLILGEIIGRILSGLYCIYCALRKDFVYFKTVSINGILAMAKRFSNFPKLIMPGQILNVIAIQIPILFIAAYFGTTDVGYFTMAMTVLTLPSSVISLSIKDVFRQRATEDFIKYGNCIEIYKKTLSFLSIISLTGYTVYTFIAPSLFKFVLGREWEISGYYSQLMVPMVAISFVSEVGGSIFIVGEKLKQEIRWQIGYFVLTTISILYGTLIAENIIITIIALSTARSIMHLFSIFCTYRIAHGK